MTLKEDPAGMPGPSDSDDSDSDCDEPAAKRQKQDASVVSIP